ncbi:DUF6090 family protein [Balneola sp. MJW-20]|uniref:DUF6090 family protein n=1 Tax=Gracilimonas aurantiaca TaxID=3234185 RepID=UPI00346723AC
MITLFRRIRQKLIDSGSVTKYLLYATGEILLVVIGILIALQVNNWNEQNTLRSQEKVYLGLILDDLILQKEENEVQRRTLSNHLSVEAPLTELIVSKFQVGEEQRDDAKKLLSTLPIGRTYGAYEATFLDLTSSGNLGLISDQVLKNRIIQHYQIQKRDREVINNNALNTYLEIWSKLVDRDLIVIAPNLERFAMDNKVLEFNHEFEFLDEELFENLSEEKNLILIQNVLAFKIAAARIAEIFLNNSDERIDQLINDLEIEISEM